MNVLATVLPLMVAVALYLSVPAVALAVAVKNTSPLLSDPPVAYSAGFTVRVSAFVSDSADVLESVTLNVIDSAQVVLAICAATVPEMVPSVDMLNPLGRLAVLPVLTVHT